MREATNEELAWAAGFIDGEGCIHIARWFPNGQHNILMSARHELRLTVGQTSREPLEKLVSLFGGHIISESIHSKMRRQAWKWQCSATTAIEGLEAMLPWLTVKSKQAKLALDFQALMRVTKPLPRNPVLGEDVAQRDAYVLALQEAKEVSC